MFSEIPFQKPSKARNPLNAANSWKYFFSYCYWIIYMPFGKFILMISNDPTYFNRLSDTFAVLSTSITEAKSRQIRPTIMATPLMSELTATFTSKTTAASKILVTRTFSISTHVSTSVSPTTRTSAEETVIVVVVIYHSFRVP